MCEEYNPDFSLGQKVWYVPDPNWVERYEEDFVIHVEIIAKETHKVEYEDESTNETFKYRVAFLETFDEVSTENFNLYATRHEAITKAYERNMSRTRLYEQRLAELAKVRDLIQSERVEEIMDDG